jgi:predicted porin
LTFDRLQVRPSVNFSAVYDDNVFAVNSDLTNDYYFIISPALLLRYGLTENKLELEYRADIYRYVDTGDSNDVEDHRMRAAADFIFPGGLSIKLGDILMRGHELRSTENLAIVSRNERSKYWSNDLNAEISYTLSERFKAALGYEFYKIGYNLDENKFRDNDKHQGSASVFYAFMPKTSVLVQGIYSKVDHYNSNAPGSSRFDSNEYWAMAGLTWDITEKSTGTIKGGYEWKVFDSPDSNDFSSAIYMVSLDHKFTPKTSIKLSGLRQAQETDDPNVSYYTTTNGAVELIFMPVSKLVIKPQGSISNNRYSGESLIAGDFTRRVDTIASGGIDILYHMNKWITVGAGYKHTKRSSTITLYDYTDNTAMITLEAAI